MIINVLHQQTTTLASEGIGVITIITSTYNGIFEAEVYHREKEEDCTLVFEFGIERSASEWNHDRMVEHVADLMIGGYFDNSNAINREVLISLGEELAEKIA